MAEIRFATADDYRELYGRLPPHRTRALAVVDGDKLLGVGGLHYEPAGVSAFMQAAEGVDVSAHKRVLVAAARRVATMAASAGSPVFAIRDACQARSESFLRHFGFELITEARDGEVWLWRH